jgi:acyl-coenzyme A thioesterase PaaI-like protein
LESGIPFMLHNGPVWFRTDGGQYECGFLPVPAIHGNLYGYVHGGMLAAFADFGLGHACWFANGERRAVTVSLEVRFVAAATVGTWIGCKVELIRRTRSLCFPRGDLVASGKVVAAASGVWKLIGG